MFVEHKEVGEVKELDAVGKLLLKAANEIEARGWCQNALVSIRGSVCLEAALAIADGADGSSQKAVQDFRLSPLSREAYYRVRSAVGQPAFKWNDDPIRTKEEVVAKLRAVAFGL